MNPIMFTLKLLAGGFFGWCLAVLWFDQGQGMIVLALIALWLIVHLLHEEDRW